MERTRTTFLGAVLKEIACTPNVNFDAEDYRRRVIEPVRGIRKLDQEVGEGELSEEQRRDVLRTLKAVLDAKGVDGAEREERLANLASRFEPSERPASIPDSRAGLSGGTAFPSAPLG